MVIQCEECKTRFRLPDEKLKPGGVKVRCTNCKHVFAVRPPEPEPAVEEMPAAEPQPSFRPEASDETSFQPPAAEETASEGEIDFDDFDTQAATEETDVSGFDFGMAFEEEQNSGAGQEAIEKEEESSEFSLGEEEPNEEYGEFSFDFEEDAGGSLPADEDSAAAGPVEFSFEEGPSWEEGEGSREASSGEDWESDFGSEFELDGEEEPAPEEEFKFTELPRAKEASPSAVPAESLAAPAVPPSVPSVGDPFDEDLEGLVRSVPLPKPRRKSSTSTVLVLVFLLLLVLAGAAAFVLWQQGRLPALDRLMRQLAGTVGGGQAEQEKIQVASLSYSTVVNGQAGELFVIRGVAFNRFPGPRSAIQVKGNLYDQQGKVLAQQAAYCGNPLDDEQLRQLPFARIQETMKNQFGEALANTNVQPGKGIPFAIVFRGVPADLATYDVETVDSQPVSQ